MNIVSRDGLNRKACGRQASISIEAEGRAAKRLLEGCGIAMEHIYFYIIRISSCAMF